MGAAPSVAFGRRERREQGLEKIRLPPERDPRPSGPPPNAIAEADANTTSVSMTTEVRLAVSRAAPYCSARLPARNRTVRPAIGSSHSAAAGAGQRTCPPAASTPATAPATIAPPRNIASARPSSGRAASRRSITLLRANEKPPTRPSQSASERGTGSPANPSPSPPPAPVSGQSTIAAPTRASTVRSVAAVAKRSPSTKIALWRRANSSCPMSRFQSTRSRISSASIVMSLIASIATSHWFR